MPDDQVPQGGGGDATPQGGNAGGGQDTPPAAGDSGGDNPKSDGSPGSQHVTPDILTGVLQRQQKSILKEVGKTFTTLQEQIEAQNKHLEDLRTASKPPKKGGDDKGGDADSPELVELRRQVKELSDANSKARDEAKIARDQEVNTRFRTLIMDALVRAKCIKPEAVFRMIRPELEFEAETNRAFTSVKSEFGEEELEADAFIKRIVSEDAGHPCSVPHLFEGKMRAGSPAGGDDGGPDGKYLYTMDQLNDPDFYVANAEKIRAALEQGKVKGAGPGMSQNVVRPAS